MSNKENNILVVGTGTIGEPLIGLLAEHQKSLCKSRRQSNSQRH